jgi:hypothetical protein
MLPAFACLLPLVAADPAHADSAGARAARDDADVRSVDAADPTDDGPTDVTSDRRIHRGKLACTRPAGKRVNYSWSYSGSGSITIYFNNHCSHRVNAKLHFYDKPGDVEVTACLNTNGGTQGRKKYTNPFRPLRKITRGCRVYQ